MSIWSAIADRITETTGSEFTVCKQQSISGGCINTTCLIEDNTRRFFVKLNHASAQEMFAAESAGLEEIITTGAICAPQPLCFGTVESQAYLVMEYIETGAADKNSMALFGQRLVTMHRAQAQQYGWKIANTIGATPQVNTLDGNWCHFWQEQRLAPQLELAARNGYEGRLQTRGERLLTELPLLLADHQPPASLLHGDLWSGNYTIDAQGMPVIFDPAVYFGDREADMAMTELFGGFSPDFYHAYREAWPLPPEYAIRKTLYNLYHILNHANLFGGSYISQAENMIDSILSEIL